jgi:hypothetical protein
MEDMDTRFNSEDDSGGEVPLPDDISIFQHGVTLVGGCRVQYIDDDVMDKLVPAWFFSCRLSSASATRSAH